MCCLNQVPKRHWFPNDPRHEYVIHLDPVTINNLELKDVVLQVWINPVQQAVKKGYKVIASHAQFWYLDCGKGGWT